MRLNFDSWFKRRILHVPNWIEIMISNLWLLEWEFKTSLTLSNRWFSRYVIAAMLVDGKQKIAH